MRQKAICIPDIIREVAQRTNAVVLPELQAKRDWIEQVNFEVGTAAEITEMLALKSQQPTLEPKRFPLIGLFIPIIESRGRQFDIYGVENVRIVIAVNTPPGIRTPERLEDNFKPILYPIYLEFMNQLYLDKRTIARTSGDFEHTKTDWPYYDTEEKANAFGTYIDAIEIRNLQLNINLKHC